MKASIIIPGYRHSLQLHELHGEINQGQGQAPLFNLREPCGWLAWNAPVHIFHLLTMIVYLEQFFVLWRVGSEPHVAMKPGV